MYSHNGLQLRTTLAESYVIEFGFALLLLLPTPPWHFLFLCLSPYSTIMSFKGFQKSIVRAPQQFKVKFNIGEHSKDAVYSDAERRFDELEKETKKLHDESKKYFAAINGESSNLSTFVPPPPKY